MASTMRTRVFLFAALAFGLAPVTFGVIRAAGPAHDLRMLWMGAASGLGAVAVLSLARPAARAGPSLLRRSAIVLAVAMLLAAAVAYGLGARAAFGVWAVAFVLAACWAASTHFAALWRRV